MESMAHNAGLDVRSLQQQQHEDVPDISVSVRQVFGIDTDMQVPAFSQANEYVPDLDEAYCFDRDTTLAILAGFAHSCDLRSPGTESILSFSWL